MPSAFAVFPPARLWASFAGRFARGRQLLGAVVLLRSAQTLLETTPGHYLLAEQGRNRVLQLQRRATGN